jgi:hypothetical protein
MSQFKSRDGRTYNVDSRGVITRVDPIKPWRGKSERRDVIKARRLQRQWEAWKNA